MACQDSVSARSDGTECGGRRGTVAAHARFRAHLLLRHLSARRPSGHPGEVPPEKEQVQLFQGSALAALSHAGGVCDCRRCRCRLAVPVAGTLQCLWPHRHDALPATVEVVQQPAGLLRGAGRQLCVLLCRCLDEVDAGAGYRCRDAGRPLRAGLAGRPHLLQHHLPRRHGAESLRPFLMAEDPLRQR